MALLSEEEVFARYYQALMAGVAARVLAEGKVGGHANIVYTEAAKLAKLMADEHKRRYP